MKHLFVAVALHYTENVPTTNLFAVVTSNSGHNILRLFDVCPNFPFTRNETKRDVSNKHGIYEEIEIPRRIKYLDIENLVPKR